MAGGVPVLVSDIPALHEVCGAAALYRSPWSVPEIADGLREISVNTSLRARLRELGDARRANLTWDRAAERLPALPPQLGCSPPWGRQAGRPSPARPPGTPAAARAATHLPR